VDRKAEKVPRKRHGDAAEDERADTDVFAAVQHPDGPDEETRTERHAEEQTERRTQEQT
jgi:hypothetical protein